MLSPPCSKPSSIDSAIVDQWKPFSPVPTPYGLYHGVDHTQRSVVGPWSATRAGRPASSQHPAFTLSRRRLSGLTLESQNESWDQFSGEVLLTEGLSQQKGFNSLIIESTILGRWEI